MRLSAGFEVVSGRIPFRSKHVLWGVASTILDGEVSTVTSVDRNISMMFAGNRECSFSGDQKYDGRMEAEVEACLCKLHSLM